MKPINAFYITLFTLILSILTAQELKSQTTATACNSYTWSTNGKTYTASGTYYAVDSSFYRSDASWLSACAAAGLTNSSVQTFNSNVSSGSFGSVSWSAYSTQGFFYVGNPHYIQTADRIADSIKITFNPGVSAVAGNFYATKADGSCSNDGRTTTITLSNGYSITYVANNLSQTFRGFIANTGSLITSITINGYLSPSLGKEYTAMDNLQVATGTVPSLNLTIDPLPAAPAGTGATICSSGTVTISATPGSGEEIDWYAAGTGGTLLSTGSSYTTPSISSTTIYYAEARNTTTNCVSATRTAVTATVGYVPSSPSGIDASRCSTGFVTISATSGTGETIDWYAASSSGSALQSNSTTYSPSVSTTTTYYAEARVTATGCLSASRTAVTATVNALPSAPTAGNNSRCSTGTVTISATPVSSEAIDWYTASSGGSALSSNSTSYTTPSISSTTSYYAEARNTTTSCVSASRTAVTATINPLPTATVSASGATTFNYGGSVVLSAPSTGNALSLNGTSNYVSIPSGINSNFSSNQITVEGWYYPTQSFDLTSLIGESSEGDNKIRFALYSVSESGVQKIKAGFYSSPTWVETVSSTDLTLNQWTHIAATYDQSNLKIYVNGNLTATLSNSNALPAGNERWLMGKRWDASSFFPGKMDEVRIWNVARSQAQIQASMNTTVASQSSGLVGYFKLDESSGTTATDATGNGYNGTVN